jgi:outer membrane biosynthesis protein TonB
MNFNRTRTARTATIIVALLIGFACTKTPNDAKVTSDIQARLGADSGLQGKQLNVQSANGRVTLSGTVDNDAQRDAAANYAASEPGVKQVINNLTVGTASAVADEKPSPAPDATETSQPATEAPSHTKSAAPSKKHHREPAPQEQPAQSAAPQQVAANSAPAAQPTPAAAPATPAPPPEPQKVTVPSGTSLAIRLIDPINSATAQPGDTFHASLDVPVAVDDQVVIPAHYDVEGQVVNAQASGKFRGQALLELQLNRIKVGDHWYDVQTDHFKQQTGSRGKNTAEKVGAGAVAGAILGGIFGGGKGAAIGSVAGAGAGGGVQAASKTPDIKLSSERILTFTLQAPVTIVPTTKPPRRGQPLDNSNTQQ